MNLLFYASTIHGATKRLQEAIETIIPEEYREIYQDIQSLSQRLREPGNGQRLAVLSASDRRDLSDIQSIQSLLSDIPIIVVLPDRKPDTITLGHRLRPRFLTYLDSDFVGLTGVLVKMIKTAASQKI